jgi:hypothetical protein
MLFKPGNNFTPESFRRGLEHVWWSIPALLDEHSQIIRLPP